MSTRDLFAGLGLAPDKKAAAESGATAQSAAPATAAVAASPAAEASVGSKLSSFLSSLKIEKDKSDDASAASSSSAPPVAAVTLSSPAAAALASVKRSATDSSRAAPTTRDKFLGLFKSDAEKRAEKEAQAKAEATAAREAAAAAFAASALPPAAAPSRSSPQGTPKPADDASADVSFAVSVSSPSADAGLSAASDLTLSPTQQIAALSRRVGELTAERDLFKENCNTLMLEQQGVEAKDTELASLRKRLEQAGEEVDALRLAIQTLSGQMSGLANTEIRLSGEIRALKQEREHNQQEHKREKEAALAAMAEREAAYLRLQAESRSHLDQIAASADQAKRLSALEDKNAKLLEAEANLRHDIGVYKAELAQSKEVQTKLDTVELENHQLRKERDKRRQEKIKEANGHGNGHAGDSAEQKPALLAVVTANGGAASHDAVLDLASAAASSTAGSATPVLHGSATPTGDISVASAHASVASSAAFVLLTEQHSLLQTKHAELEQTQSATLADLALSKAQFSALEAEHASSVAALEALTTKHAELARTNEETVANRNYYKRKCDSLSSSVDKMLRDSQQSAAAATAAAPSLSSSAADAAPQSRGLTASSSGSRLSSPLDVERERHVYELKNLHAKLAQSRQEKDELAQTLAAYKRTLESNHAMLKSEREANLLLSKSGAASGSGLFGRGKGQQQQLMQQFESVRALANSLSELITDKDLSIEHLKRANQLLAARVFELEKRFQHQLEDDDAAAGGARRMFGTVDLEKEEREYQANQSAAASTTGSRRNSLPNSQETAEKKSDEVA